MLWYFPYENDQETVPLDPHTMGRMLLMANRGLDGAATQNHNATGGLRALTQLGGPSQVAAWQTQRHTQALGGQGRKQAQLEQDASDFEVAGQAYMHITLNDLQITADLHDWPQWPKHTAGSWFCPCGSTVNLAQLLLRLLTRRGPTDLLAAGMSALLAACPTFETFWQGRLIPGACVDTLPFIRAVRCKRSAAGKDLLPDDVFSRVR